MRWSCVLALHKKFCSSVDGDGVNDDGDDECYDGDGEEP